MWFPVPKSATIRFLSLSAFPYLHLVAVRIAIFIKLGLYLEENLCNNIHMITLFLFCRLTKKEVVLVTCHVIPYLFVYSVPFWRPHAGLQINTVNNKFFYRVANRNKKLYCTKTLLYMKNLVGLIIRSS